MLDMLCHKQAMIITQKEQICWIYYVFKAYNLLVYQVISKLLQLNNTYLSGVLSLLLDINNNYSTQIVPTMNVSFLAYFYQVSQTDS